MAVVAIAATMTAGIMEGMLAVMTATIMAIMAAAITLEALAAMKAVVMMAAAGTSPGHFAITGIHLDGPVIGISPVMGPRRALHQPSAACP